jgi:GT2 family glycosyltransferase
MKYDISIIIVNFNTARMVVELIRSIVRDESRLELEFIVVDNGSGEEDVHILNTFLSAFDNAVFIKNNDNLGFAKASNQGIRKANGKYVLLLNSDMVIIHKRVLRKLFDFTQTKEDAGVVAPKLIEKDKRTIQPSCFRFPTIKAAVDEFWCRKEKKFEKYVPGGPMPVAVDAVVGAAFLITPKALKSVGLLDERYFMYYEDLDYCRRVWQKGLKVYYMPGIKIVHYHGASGEKLADSENQWRRLIPSSKIYHGRLKHHLLTGVIWAGQKKQKLFNGKKS